MELSPMSCFKCSGSNPSICIVNNSYSNISNLTRSVVVDNAKLNWGSNRTKYGVRLKGRASKSKKIEMAYNRYTATTAPTTSINSRYIGSCLVVAPPGDVKPRAIVKFLGGAFIGAIPHVSYSYLLQLLANQGYLIVSVPYNVTFDHAQAARDVYEKFTACLDMIFASGLPDLNLAPSDLAPLPLYSIGHSNGALLQTLTGSYFSEQIPKANVIISFNNRPATEAVPYFEQLGPFVSQLKPIVEASPFSPMAQSASDASRVLLDIAGAAVPNNDPESIINLQKFVDQLPSVFDEISQGISEFTPKPAENRDFVQQCYNVPRTLLVKFNFDTIDDTDLLEESLKPRVDYIGGKLEKISLNGTHLTPCAQEPVWQVGKLYTPADAILQGLKWMGLSDTRTLSSTICQWLEDNAIESEL